MLTNTVILADDLQNTLPYKSLHCSMFCTSKFYVNHTSEEKVEKVATSYLNVKGVAWQSFFLCDHHPYLLNICLCGYDFTWKR